MVRRDSIIGKVSLLSKFPAYYESKKQKLLKRDRLPAKETTKIATTLLSEIAEQIHTADAGVYINGFGYFAVVMSMNKQRQFAYFHNTATNENTMKKVYNDNTRNHVFRVLYFTNVERNNPFRFWSFENMFSREVTRPLAKRLKTGDMTLLRWYEVSKLNKTTKKS